MRRPVPAVLVALAFAALGAVILGEYELAGLRPVLAGVLFGITVAEVLATLARRWAGDPELWAAAALITEAGLVWATWISTGHELDEASTTARPRSPAGGGSPGPCRWRRSGRRDRIR